MKIKDRFRGFLPIVVDIETAGFEPKTDAVLEVAMVTIQPCSEGFVPDQTFATNVLPFEGANLNPEALKFNGIHEPFNPLRAALKEPDALALLFPQIKELVKLHGCSRAILVGHNAWFDLHFLNAMAERCEIKSPFHGFSSFDTATMGMLSYQHTVLAELAKRASIPWDNKEAHSAIYDAEKTAELFCNIINRHDAVF